MVGSLLAARYFWSTDHLWFVILSEAKDLLSRCKKQVLRFAQDDKPGIIFHENFPSLAARLR
jgi:hypothetical protein